MAVGLTHVGETIIKLPQFRVTKKDVVTCSKHGRYTQTTYQSGRITKCPGCERDSEERRIKAENDKLKEAAEKRKSRRIDELLGKSGIPKRFQDKTFDNYQLSEDNDNQEEVFNRVVAFSEEFKPSSEESKPSSEESKPSSEESKPSQEHSGRCIVMIGDTGTGKSHLACAVASHVIKKYCGTARFTSVSEINRLVRESKGYNAKYSETEVIEAFGNYDLLIVDEVGIQSGSDAESRALFDVFNARYQNKKSTIVISNLNQAQVKEALGQRIFDRLKEGGGEVLVFHWGSHRV